MKLITALHRLVEHRWPVRLGPTVRTYLHEAGAALGVPDRLDTDADVEAPSNASSLRRPGRGHDLNHLRADRVGSRLHGQRHSGHGDALVDVRTLPGTADEVAATIDALLGPDVEWELLSNTQPVAAPVDAPWFAGMADAIRAEDPDAVVVPSCMGAGPTPRRLLGSASPAMGSLPSSSRPTSSTAARAPGVNERVPVDGLRFGARVLDRFLTPR